MPQGTRQETPEKKCPYCESTNVEHRGIRENREGAKPIYRCRACGRKFSEHLNNLTKKTPERLEWVLKRYPEIKNWAKLAKEFEQVFGIPIHYENLSRWYYKAKKGKKGRRSVQS
jgi:transposase-like protein